jgi:DNA-binding NtrC family response regulator
VLEKSQFIDKDRLQKYLKGRQHLGSTDNLPVLSRKESEEEFNGQQSTTDTGIIYRALVEMRTDISDLKKMLAKFLYSTFSEKEIKALPSAVSRNIDPNDISGHIRDQMDDSSLGIRSVDTTVEEDDDEEEVDDIEQFFADKEIPSIEEAEKFLIEQALKRFDGNRRKASEALGVSERTLYRKLDQYGLQ